MGIKQENLDKPAAQFQYVISDQVQVLYQANAQTFKYISIRST